MVYTVSIFETWFAQSILKLTKPDIVFIEFLFLKFIMVEMLVDTGVLIGFS